MIKSHHLEHRNSQRLTDGRSVEKPTRGAAKEPRGTLQEACPPWSLHTGLTDEAVEHGVPSVVSGDGVLPVHYAQLRSVFERVLPKAQQVQDAAQRLQGRREGGAGGVTGRPCPWIRRGGQGSGWSDSP